MGPWCSRAGAPSCHALSHLSLSDPFLWVRPGPAGGVVGYAKTTLGVETDEPVIGFDMGGTSTDVSRFDGTFEQVRGAPLSR